LEVKGIPPLSLKMEVYGLFLHRGLPKTGKEVGDGAGGGVTPMWWLDGGRADSGSGAATAAPVFCYAGMRERGKRMKWVLYVFVR